MGTPPAQPPSCARAAGRTCPSPPDPNPAARRPGCKVILLVPGWRAYKTHFGNKVPLPGVLLHPKASGRKRTHPLASHHRRTRVPEREIPAPPVLIRTGGPRRTLCFLEEGSIGPSVPRPSDAFLSDAAWEGRGPPGGCTRAVLTESDLNPQETLHPEPSEGLGCWEVSSGRADWLGRVLGMGL